MKKIQLALAHLLFILFLPCGHAQDSLTIILDWFPYPAHAPLFVGIDHGFFQAQGLTVNIISPADPAVPAKWVAAGKADMAITYAPQFIEDIDQGLPLIRIATLIDKPLDCLAVLKTASIKTIANLKGKRIAYSVNGLGNIALKTMLEKNGLSLNDVELINVHYDLTQALLAKKVDAITSIMRNLEIIQLQLMNIPVEVFFPEKNGVPSYSELIFVINKQQALDPRYAKFVIGLQQSTDFLLQHPESAWREFAKKHPQMNTKLYHQAWFASLPYFARRPAEFNVEEWLSFATFMQKNGLIKQVQPINHYAINLVGKAL